MCKSIDLSKRQTDIEFYENILRDYVVNRKLSFPFDSDILTKYIALFSLYVCKSNDAYLYNLPYISEQHKRFVHFLEIASQKYDILYKIIQKIKKESELLAFTYSHNYKDDIISISLNDFLRSDLNGNIDLMDDFLISGAERNPQNDIITITYNFNDIIYTRTCNVFNKHDKQTVNYDKILSALKEILNINNKE